MPTSPSLRLSNAYPQTGDARREVVTARISLPCFNYFFRGIFAGEPSVFQNIISTFFAKLHAECIASGIPAHWDEDSQAQIVSFLHDLNFRPPSPGCPDPCPPKPKAKPAPRKRNPGGTSGGRKKGKGTSGETTESEIDSARIEAGNELPNKVWNQEGS